MEVRSSGTLNCQGPLYLKRVASSAASYDSSANIPTNESIVIVTSTTTTNRYIEAGISGQLLLIVNYSGKKFNILRNDTGALVTAIKVDHGALFRFFGHSWLCVMQGPTWSS